MPDRRSFLIGAFALFHHWTVDKDPRIPTMLRAWCDFLDARGLRPDAPEAFEQWSKTDLNDTPRAYNWALQASGQMIYLLTHIPDDV
jgi:hypothetical protein